MVFKEASDKEIKEAFEGLNKIWVHWMFQGYDPMELLYYNFSCFLVAIKRIEEKAKENRKEK